MKARRFVELVQLAIAEQYGEESEFDTVPYIHEDQGPMVRCLGVFLTENMAMAPIAARATELIVRSSKDGPEALREEIDGFVDVMSNMLVAPYMQWHCAYWPGLTQDQVDAGCEAFEDPDPGDRSASEVLGGPEPKRLTSEDLFSWLEHGGADASWYSGRGMMGAECPSVCGDHATVHDAVASAIVCMRDQVDDGAYDDAVRRLMNYRTDNMGVGVVLYWPDERRVAVEGDGS